MKKPRDNQDSAFAIKQIEQLHSEQTIDIRLKTVEGKISDW
jgi:hypothetical protein